MSTKVKTPAQQTVTPTANTQVQTALPKPRPFAETNLASETETASFSSLNLAAATPPPPDVRRKSEFDLQKIAIFDHIPATIQTKMVVGAPNDKYEQEADRMAERVMAMSDNVGADGRQDNVEIQRQEDEEDISLKSLGETIQCQDVSAEDEGINLKPLAETLQRMDYEDDGITLKAKESKQINRDGGRGSFTASAEIENNLKSKGGGKPIPKDTRNFMESRFGNDFSNVRLHTDNKAVQMNRDLHAKAFTHGKDIYFNSGQLNTQSNSGKTLLAHELTHTIQQTGHTSLKRIDTKVEKPNKLTETKGKVNNLQKQPLAKTIQRADYEDEGITLKALNTTISPSGLSIQRENKKDKKAKFREDRQNADRKIADEIADREKEGGDLSEAREAQGAVKREGASAEATINNVKNEKDGQTKAKTLETQAAQATERQQQQLAATEVRNQEKQQQQDRQDKEKAEQEKQEAQQEIAEAVAEDGEDEAKGESEGETGASQGDDEPGAIEPENSEREGENPEATNAVPETPKAPNSPQEDPAFQAVIKQTEDLATAQSEHKPAPEKVKQAQEAATDASKQMRDAQVSQSKEAATKQPGIFDREAFISSLLQALGINKPQTQEQVSRGEGARGAAHAIKQEVNKSKQAAGGELTATATKAPNPAAEAPKTVVPLPGVEQEMGTPIPNEAVKAELAVPKEKTAPEIETPFANIKDQLDSFVPQTPQVQAKLVVGAPRDKYELEADRMAAKVMAMPVGKMGDGELAIGSRQSGVERKEIDGELEQNPKNIESHPLQRKVDKFMPAGKMVQLFPGIFIQREAATLTPEAPVDAASMLTQEGNEVKIDQNRMARYQADAGVDAQGALDEAKTNSETAPQTFRQDEQANIATTIGEQIQQRDGSNQEMSATRQQEHQNVHNSQQEAKSKDEIARTQVSQNVQNIYNETKGNVNGILARMDARVNAEFARTNAAANAIFERTQRVEFARWKHEYYHNRHPLWLPHIWTESGWAYFRVHASWRKHFNTPKWVWNKVITGLPGEVNNIYEVAKRKYLEVQKAGVYRIADIVEQEMNNAKAEVDRGRQRVADYVATLPNNLKQVGADAASKVEAQFNSLETSIQEKQDQLVDSLTAKYQASLDKINKRIEQLKAENQSLVSKVVKAIGNIAKWLLKKVLMVLKPVLAKIPGVGDKAGKFIDAFVDDPGKFMSNLFKGIGQGFKNFGSNILKHLKQAFFTWLLGSGLDIKFPQKFDLQGILDIVLQVLGLTKDYIFQLAGEHLPNWAATLLQTVVEKGESAFADVEETLKEMGVPGLVISFFKALIAVPAKGVMALWDFIKSGISDLKEQFMGTVMTQVVIPQVVIAGIQWVLGLMNPASGIIRIMKAVIDLILFFIQNMGTIKKVIASIGNTFEAILSGAVGLIAKAVEQSLADILPVLLGLFISILGLGAIPRAVSKVIETLRKPIDKTVGTIFKKVGGFFDKIGGKIKGKLGLNKKDEDNAEERAESAANEIGSLAQKERDPKKVKSKTKGIKNKYQLEKFKFKEPGKTFFTNKRYIITANTKQIKNNKKNKTENKQKNKTRVRRKPLHNSSQLPAVQPQLEREITSSQGKGTHLPNTVQTSMESGFNRDLSGVKIHHDAQSDRLNRALDAKAFTVGQDVYFRKGNYNPHSQPGKQLLAHELSHVVQQSGDNSPRVLQRKPVNWQDKKKELVVKEKVSGNKKKAKLYIKAKLINQGDILKNVKKKLKKIITKSQGKYRTIRAQVPKIKKEFNLASISTQKKDKSGDEYKIIAKIKPPKKAQRKAIGGGGNINIVDSAIADTIQRTQGKGTALSQPAKEPMERAFGYDFSPVRIHHNSQSDRLSRSLNARAFTVGGDIFFRQGAYKPESSGGKQLLAHELTHVVQQSGAKPNIMPDRGTSSQSNSHSPLTTLSSRSNGVVQRSGGAVGASLAADALRAGVLFGDGQTDVDIKSKIKDNTLEMDVKRERSSGDLIDDLSGENDSEGESESLPNELVNDIVKVIMAIVNQSPDPDVVDSKLDDVRRNFDLRLVDLVSSAEIGNNYEYIIKVKGKAKAVKPKGIKDFLNSLKNQAISLGRKAVTKDDNDFSKQEELVTEKPKKIESQPATNNQLDTNKNSPEINKPVVENTVPEPTLIAEQQPEKNKAKNKQKQEEESGGIKVDVNTKVVRIDDSTVDITVRANPK